jgi:hypothetical protein
LLILVSSFFFTLSAREVRVEQSDSLAFHFRCALWDIDQAVSSNRQQLEHLQSLIKRMGDEAPDTIHITLCGSASPEGKASYNVTLSRRRAESVERILRDRLGIDGVTYDITWIGDNWNDLRRLVEESDIMARAEVLDIFTATEGDATGERRKRLMMSLNGSNTWRELNRSFFPQLRKVDIIVSYGETRTVSDEPTTPIVFDEPLDADEVIEAPSDAIEPVAVAPIAVPVEKHSGGKFLMLLKTNMLYDVLAVPNIGVEFPLPKHFSVGADWAYAWWKTDTFHRYWRTYGGDIFARKWLGNGETSCTGHHIGLYGGIVTYDFELGGRGYLGDKWSYDFGVEYGYSLRIAHRLNIDFNLGAGYLGGIYKEYLPIDDHYVWQSTKRRHWIGPTKVEISLVYFIGNAYRSARKGGGR